MAAGGPVYLFSEWFNGPDHYHGVWEDFELGFLEQWREMPDWQFGVRSNSALDRFGTALLFDMPRDYRQAVKQGLVFRFEPAYGIVNAKKFLEAVSDRKPADLRKFKTEFEALLQNLRGRARMQDIGIAPYFVFAAGDAAARVEGWIKYIDSRLPPPDEAQPPPLKRQRVAAAAALLRYHEGDVELSAQALLRGWG